MNSKKALIISIVIFVILGCIALYLVLNKGHVGSYALVAIDETKSASQEAIVPKITLDFDKDFLVSTNKKDKIIMTVTKDGEVVTDGVVFASSDNKIVKIVDNNLVPVSNGKATIKATYDGIETTKDIKVITPIKNMTFTSTNSVVRVGKDLQMKLKITPSNADISGLEYESDDETVALVDSSGIVTGVEPGKVQITVRDVYSGLEKTVNLTIKK